MAGLKIVFVIVFCYALAFCNSQKNSEQKTPVDETKMAYVEFLNPDSSVNIEVLTEVAENDYERSKGLMYRKELPENQGMLFIFDEEKKRYFWMKNTIVSLDIIFINAGYEIIKIHKDTTPYSTQNYASGEPAKYVVEVRAGFTERYQIVEGNFIKVNEL